MNKSMLKMLPKMLAPVLFLSLFPVPAFAQLTNEGFEEWENKGGTDIPIGWNHSPGGIGKADSSASGEYGLSVWNWYYYGLGYVFSDQSGRTQAFSMDQGGVPIDYLPEKLTGYYKFDRGSAPDTANAVVFLMFRRYNAAAEKSDTVSLVKHVLLPSAGWRRFDIPIPPSASGLRPDTMVVGFFSSDPTPDHRVMCHLDTGNCCFLSIDDVALVNSSGVPRSISTLLAPMQILPNPVVDGARLQFDGEEGTSYHLTIHDASGRLALEQEISGSSVDLSGLELPSGAYHASVVAASGALVAAGRFVVGK